MVQKKTKNLTLRTKAYREIKNKIVYLDLKPGDKIFESEIAQVLNMSRTPVREALLLLENEHLVVCDDRLGFLVKKLTSKEIEEYFDIRMAFEVFAVPYIVERITPSDIDDLKKNIEYAEISVNNEDVRNIIKYESEFHDIYYRATKSDVFYQTISGLIDKFQWLRAMAISAPHGAHQSFSDHKEIMIAIGNRDQNKLQLCLKRHIEHARDRFEYMKPFFMG